MSLCHLLLPGNSVMYFMDWLCANRLFLDVTRCKN